jgi:hypothetical protein
VIETEEPDVDSKLKSWCNLLDRGLAIRKSDLYEMIGASMPGPHDAVLGKQGEKPSKEPPAGAPAGKEPPPVSVRRLPIRTYRAANRHFTNRRCSAVFRSTATAHAESRLRCESPSANASPAVRAAVAVVL